MVPDRSVVGSQVPKEHDTAQDAKTVREAVMSARALIFDVDGTLAETEDLHRRAFNETFAYFHLGWDWDVELYRKLLMVTGGKERIRHFASSVTDDSCGLTNDEIVRMHRFKTERYVQLIATFQCPLRPGVADLIKSARSRGQRLAIATTTSRKNVEALLESTMGSEGAAAFEIVIAGEDVVRKKPAPDVYINVLQHLDLAGSDCVAFEDSQNGLDSALKAKIPVIVTPSAYGHNSDFTGALVVLESLDDLQL